MTPAGILALAAAAFGAGVMNAMAGGGTILTFPTLVFLGLPAITANATSTVALLPGAAASLLGYREEVWEHRRWLRTLFLPSVLGGALGAVLLLRTPERTFSFLAPILILFATALFTIQGAVSRWTSVRREDAGADGSPRPARWAVAWILQLGVAIYGGYFGAGIGILGLALLGFLGLSNIHAANGVKNFFGVCINAVAAGYFILERAVAWPEAMVVAVGAILGGYGGARFARRIGKEKARAAVVVIGLLVTAILVWQQAGK
jgi:uncharacterized protein